jgi:hypothetical protein
MTNITNISINMVMTNQRNVSSKGMTVGCIENIPAARKYGYKTYEDILSAGELKLKASEAYPGCKSRDECGIHCCSVVFDRKKDFELNVQSVEGFSREN